MLNLAIVFAVLLLLPFFLAYLHISAKKTTDEPFVVYYRYFVLFDVVFAGIFVAIRMVVDGQHAASLAGWAYSPMFDLYGIAVLSMALSGLLVFIPNEKKIYTPALTWILFVLLSTAAYFYVLTRQEINSIQTIYLHIIYNLIVVGVLLYFVQKLISTKEKNRVARSINSREISQDA